MAENSIIDTVNSRQWPQWLRAQCDARRITPYEYIVGSKARPEAMNQTEVGAELARLAHLKERLSHPKRTEFVNTFPTQWRIKPLTPKAWSFAVEIIHELRKLAGEEKQ